MEYLFDDLLSAGTVPQVDGEEIGKSRTGRPIRAHRFGGGPTTVSLIAGNHADEPAGPRLLDLLARYLSCQEADSPLLNEYSWWLVPHSNPDGRELNASWQDSLRESVELGRYLKYSRRELPGDDMEFGFPRDGADVEARPENLAIAKWWSESGGFDLHASLHGMGFAAGPWFLIDPAWRECCEHVIKRCSSAVRNLGYRLHDVERFGEKGFCRIERGFCTRPNSNAMREFFLERGDSETAQKFRPSSMEYVRGLGKDTLTLVSEMPLFILPRVGEVLGPPDPAAEQWRAQIENWRARLADGADCEEISSEGAQQGVTAMPLCDQMRLQWVFICSGLEQIKQR